MLVIRYFTQRQSHLWLYMINTYDTIHMINVLKKKIVKRQWSVGFLKMFTCESASKILLYSNLNIYNNLKSQYLILMQSFRFVKSEEYYFYDKTIKLFRKFFFLYKIFML